MRPRKESLLHVFGRDRVYKTEPDVGYTKSGQAFHTIRRKMLIAADRIPDSVFYLYENEDEAERGSVYGATGFMMFQVSPVTGLHYAYAVTNTHSINDGFPVIRINRIDGGKPDIIPAKALNWIPHQHGADVSAAYIRDARQYSFESINAIHLLGREELDEPFAPFLLGSEIHMVGRFGGSAGKYRNRPVVRSGIISQFPDPNPDELIKYDKAIEPQEAWLTEMHSISGFSGSPVFHTLYSFVTYSFIKPILESFYNLTANPELDKKWTDWDEVSNPIKLIGIDAGAFSSWNEMRIRDKGDVHPVHYEGKSATGFSIIIPSWKIKELLLQPELLNPMIEGDSEAQQNPTIAEPH